MLWVLDVSCASGCAGGGAGAVPHVRAHAEPTASLWHYQSVKGRTESSPRRSAGGRVVAVKMCIRMVPLTAEHDRKKKKKTNCFSQSTHESRGMTRWESVVVDGWGLLLWVGLVLARAIFETVKISEAKPPLGD